MRVIYTAAHAGASTAVPIGGGGAIASMLAAEWAITQPFELVVIRPDEDANEVVTYSEREYAAFCHRFRRYATHRILSEDPKQCVVLVNDISEGPDFDLLARHGYRIYTIWHVDVVAYVARMYLRDWISPSTLVRLVRPVEKLLPAIAKLVFHQQRSCVEKSAGHIVMTEAMKQMILNCYPSTPPEKIHVVPWGAPPRVLTGKPRELAKPVLLTLSRISPEKGLDRLLQMLSRWRGRATLLLCGGAAYMEGKRYLASLRAIASGMERVKVEFAGHLSGQAKADAFASADLYLFPSVFESYGLTLMEALSHGVPVIAFDHDGARAIVQPDFGILVRNEQELHVALDTLLGDPERRAAMSAAAKAYANARPFAKSAHRVARLLQS
ncbi:glycosyltransferase family 4 protein [Bryobacter aggregatus]|uniref:glycosyltransferase family 4 protein n=1 Tax=Bryobacter aggregatus TaxID=360054 RepID=UPI0004E262DB|nr:glycosyltransferase family 4 protein [Bryobacter aggregatus]